MKQQPLTDEERILLVAYRLERAKETLLEADNLANANFYNAAINRLYYACYYAVIALLLKNNISAQTHQGVKQMFSLHFIASGKMDKKYSAFYGRLFNDRMSGDYDDFVQYDKAMLDIVQPQAKDFVFTIEKEIQSLFPIRSNT